MIAHSFIRTFETRHLYGFLESCLEPQNLLLANVGVVVLLAKLYSFKKVVYKNYKIYTALM